MSSWLSTGGSMSNICIHFGVFSGTITIMATLVQSLVFCSGFKKGYCIVLGEILVIVTAT